MSATETVLRILDLARWAPSGDNTQPWRFRAVSADQIEVHGFDTREWCLYDYRGYASRMAHGALLETLRIAASGERLHADWASREGCPDHQPIYDVRLRPLPEAAIADPLLACIKTRVVQRRPMKMTPLTAGQKAALAAAPGAGYSVQFFELLSERFAVGRLLWRNAYVRLVCPEAYPVHREIIEWAARDSEDRIPEYAVGIDPLTARLMRWVMKSWGRVDFFNRYLFGTIPPRIQLDFLPAMACAAHLLLRPSRPPEGAEDYVAAGVAMQRIWLTAAAEGLYLQPEMTPLIFRWYVRSGARFSALDSLATRAEALAAEIEAIADAGADDPMAFFCRIGRADPPEGRSLRIPLGKLMLDQ